jgi:hypothetical protein
MTARLAEYEETAIKIGRFAQSLTVHMMLIDDGIDAWRHIAEGLVKASMVVDGIEMISAHGNFLYFQDTASVHFARMIVFLHNVSDHAVLLCSAGNGWRRSQLLTTVLPTLHADSAITGC